MYISIDWIKDYVELPDLPPEELAVRFTMATCEVEEVKTTGELLEKVRIVEITEIQDHPDSDHLHLVKFTDGKNSRDVVCGAPNVAVGKESSLCPPGNNFCRRLYSGAQKNPRESCLRGCSAVRPNWK